MNFSDFKFEQKLVTQPYSYFGEPSNYMKISHVDASNQTPFTAIFLNNGTPSMVADPRWGFANPAMDFHAAASNSPATGAATTFAYIRMQSLDKYPSWLIILNQWGYTARIWNDYVSIHRGRTYQVQFRNDATGELSDIGSVTTI